MNTFTVHENVSIEPHEIGCTPGVSAVSLNRPAYPHVIVASNDRLPWPVMVTQSSDPLGDLSQRAVSLDERSRAQETIARYMNAAILPYNLHCRVGRTMARTDAALPVAQSSEPSRTHGPTGASDAPMPLFCDSAKAEEPAKPQREPLVYSSSEDKERK